MLEQDGTTDAVAWVSVADVDAGAVDVLEVVRWALGRDRSAAPGSGLPDAGRRPPPT